MDPSILGRSIFGDHIKPRFVIPSNDQPFDCHTLRYINPMRYAFRVLLHEGDNCEVYGLRLTPIPLPSLY